MFVATGIASLVLGLFVTLNEMSPDINNFLKFDAAYGIGSGVGPLSGKVVLATIAFIVSWVVLHIMWRGKELDFRKVFTASLILVGLGFALTFPPIFLLFEPA
ncbi:MAG: hypothetical protein A2Z32_08980 [Chloroflexi bacterium RBG_16_69_14]|nr:MAG: hypothetical protein A2Z32_08980 [Chloroflexi bacterium RBG_16_69_14]